MSSEKPKPSDTEEPPFLRHPAILPPLDTAANAIIQARTAISKAGVSIPPDNVSLMDVPARDLLKAVANIRGIKVETDEEDEPTEGELLVEEVVAEFERDIEKKGPAKRKRRKGKGATLDEQMRKNWSRKPENPGVAVARVADIGRAFLRKMITKKEAEALAEPLIASFGNNPTKAMEGVIKEFTAAMGKANPAAEQTAAEE